MIRYTVTGDTRNLDSFLDKMLRGDPDRAIARYAQKGVDVLRAATPTSSGLTANSWEYEIVKEGGSTTIWWNNTNVVNGFNVAIGLQYGHGTGTGGWVAGYDFINPAIRPIFDEIANAVWKEVQRA